MRRHFFVLLLLIFFVLGSCAANTYGQIGATSTTIDTAEQTSHSDINSKWGYIGESIDHLYLLSNIEIDKIRGIILDNGKKLVENEMVKLHVNNGDVYFNDRSGVNKLNGGSASQVLKKKILSYAIINEKLYYIENAKLYCYNMNEKTNSLVYDEPTAAFYVNSDYVICRDSHNIIILDNESYTVIKEIYHENIITDFYVDKDNIYFIEIAYINTIEQKHKIIKYNIIQDKQATVFDSDELVSTLFAIDDKIVFYHAVDNRLGIRYIDTRNMENKFFTIDNEIDIIDILFDGQQIIFKSRDEAFYSIDILTGNTEEIE